MALHCTAERKAERERESKENKRQGVGKKSCDPAEINLTVTVTANFVKQLSPSLCP